MCKKFQFITIVILSIITINVFANPRKTKRAATSKNNKRAATSSKSPVNTRSNPRRASSSNSQRNIRVSSRSNVATGATGAPAEVATQTDKSKILPCPINQVVEQNDSEFLSSKTVKCAMPTIENVEMAKAGGMDNVPGWIIPSKAYTFKCFTGFTYRNSTCELLAPTCPLDTVIRRGGDGKLYDKTEEVCENPTPSSDYDFVKATKEQAYGADIPYNLAYIINSKAKVVEEPATLELVEDTPEVVTVDCGFGKYYGGTGCVECVGGTFHTKLNSTSAADCKSYSSINDDVWPKGLSLSDFVLVKRLTGFQTALNYPLTPGLYRVVLKGGDGGGSYGGNGGKFSYTFDVKTATTVTLKSAEGGKTDSFSKAGGGGGASLMSNLGGSGEFIWANGGNGVEGISGLGISGGMGGDGIKPATCGGSKVSSMCHGRAGAGAAGPQTDTRGSYNFLISRKNGGYQDEHGFNEPSTVKVAKKGNGDGFIELYRLNDGNDSYFK